MYPVSLVFFFLLLIEDASSHSAGSYGYDDLSFEENLLVKRDVDPGTTLPATDCASPSCTVTPTLASSLTIQPTPVTINAPGAVTPVVLTFDAITTKPSPEMTVLANKDPAANLTLGKTTFSNIQATATTDYLVSPTETLSVAVVAEVEAEGQLTFSFNNDPDSVCELFPDSVLSSREEAMSKSYHMARGLKKRQLVFADITGANKEYVQMARSDAIIVLSRFVLFGRRFSDQTTIVARGLSTWYLPTFYPRLFNMANAQLKALTTRSITTPWTAFEKQPAMQNSLCSPPGVQEHMRPLALTIHADRYPNRPGGRSCSARGYTLLCPRALQFGMPLPNDISNFCSAGSGNQMNLNAGRYNFSTDLGSRARVMIHELTHLDTIGAFTGDPFGGSSTSTNANPGTANEVYQAEARALIQTANRVPSDADTIAAKQLLINNADNYALAILEWYLRDLCGWN